MSEYISDLKSFISRCTWMCLFRIYMLYMRHCVIMTWVSCWSIVDIAFIEDYNSSCSKCWLQQHEQKYSVESWINCYKIKQRLHDWYSLILKHCGFYTILLVVLGYVVVSFKLQYVYILVITDRPVGPIFCNFTNCCPGG